VDLQVLVSLAGLLGAVALALRVVIVFAVLGLLVDQSLPGEEVADETTFLHHVLGERTDDAHYT